MAASLVEVQPRGSLDFVESSVLEAVVPVESAVSIGEELGSWDGAANETGSILPFLKQRQVLLFDEKLPVHVVFRTPLLDEGTLTSYLSRLAISLDVFVFGSAPASDQEPKANPPKELIYSVAIKDTKPPTVTHHDKGDAEYTYVSWKVEVPLSRPQGRFHKPGIYLQPIASLKPAESTQKPAVLDEYLPSRVPTALNLLQSFENDPALAGIHPRLSAMRISKMAPSAPLAREMTRPIRSGQRPLFRVVPPLMWRIKFSKIQAPLGDLSLMASLDLEVAQYTMYSIRIKKISLILLGGGVKALAGQDDATTMYKPGDQLSYMYKVKPDLAPDGTPVLGSKGHVMTLNVEAEVFVSKECQPSVAIEWKTPVDFVSEQSTTLIKAAHRLSSLSLQNGKVTSPDALPAHDVHNQQNGAHNAINVTLTVSGPAKVRVGEMFHWDVFIVNRSDKARKLAVLVISKRKRDYERHKSHASASSMSGTGADKKELVASAIVDENIVYAKQKSARVEAAELVCLTTDIRLGQLSPGSCYRADLKFLALSAGVLSVESVRVIDLATNETADIRELPSIVAVEKEDEFGEIAL